jgi:hypothetical protein
MLAFKNPKLKEQKLSEMLKEPAKKDKKILNLSDEFV